MSRAHLDAPARAVTDRTGRTGRDETVGGGPDPTARALLTLQATAGNSAVARLLSRARFKLAVSTPGDQLEREADGLADRIVRAPVVAPDTAVTEPRPSAGQPLPDAVRHQAELVLRRDLGGVRVHTSGRAAAAAREVGARAFTVGDDITFGGGEYVPGSTAGRWLLAHELAHRALQAAGRTAVVQRN